MTEAKARAAEIWQAVRLRNMPRGIALDAVQDLCGGRSESLAQILAVAIQDANERRKKVTERGWRKSHLRERAEWIVTQMELRNWEAADRERRNASGSGETDWRSRYTWRDWVPRDEGRHPPVPGAVCRRVSLEADTGVIGYVTQ